MRNELNIAKTNTYVDGREITLWVMRVISCWIGPEKEFYAILQKILEFSLTHVSLFAGACLQ